MARKVRGMPCERGWGSLGEHPSTQHSNPHTSLFSLHVFDTMSHVPSFPLTYIATQGPACDHSPVCSQWGPAQEASKASHLGCGDTVPIPFTHDPSVCTCMCVRACVWRGGCSAANPASLPPSSRACLPPLPTPTRCFRLHRMLSSSPYALAWHLFVFLHLSLPPLVPAVSHQFPRRVLRAMCSISVFVLLFCGRRHFNSLCSVVIGFAHWVVLILIVI